jgi:hypothetical protein
MKIVFNGIWMRFGYVEFDDSLIPLLLLLLRLLLLAITDASVEFT